MPKKLKLSDLSVNEKTRLSNAVITSLVVAFVAGVVVVGCLSCSQKTPSPNPSMDGEMQRLHWMEAVCDTEWKPQTNERYDGILEGLPRALPATIWRKEGSSDLSIGFGSSMPYLKTGTIRLESREGAIVFEDGGSWMVRFSEKNGVKYMTIVDSREKAVYYTCL